MSQVFDDEDYALDGWIRDIFFIHLYNSQIIYKFAN
jgi:hypothetical protein